MIDLLAIHPFVDANGRVACILADLLAIREGLAPYFFHSIKDADLPALCRALELAETTRELSPVHAMLVNRNGVTTA